MTGIVGPNGCGKSNIIDAIRWVMGESAASRLRGEALSRRDLLRLDRAQAGRQRNRGTDLRQFRRHDRRRIRELQRDLGQAQRQPRRPVAVLPERHALPASRHHRPVSRHRSRRAQLLDHRAGHDLGDHLGAPRRIARPSRGSGRHFQVQGAAQGDREPDQGDARESRAPERRARGSRKAARAPESSGAGRGALAEPEGRAGTARGRTARVALSQHRRGTRRTRGGDHARRGRDRSAARRPAPGRSAARGASREAPRGDRTPEQGPGRGLPGRRRDRARRAADPAQPRAWRAPERERAETEKAWPNSTSTCAPTAIRSRR